MTTDNSIELDIKQMAIDAIIKNAERIDWGDGIRLAYHAKDVPLGTGQADLLLIDKGNSTLYVVEIVSRESGAEDIGRLLSHYGWLKRMLLPASVPAASKDCEPGLPTPSMFPEVTDVKGIIVAVSFSAGALCALAVCPDLIAKTYQFSIELNRP